MGMGFVEGVVIVNNGAKGVQKVVGGWWRTGWNKLVQISA